MEINLDTFSATIAALQKPSSVNELATLIVEKSKEFSAAEFGFFLQFSRKSAKPKIVYSNFRTEFFNDNRTNSLMQTVLQTKTFLIFNNDEISVDQKSGLLLPILYDGTVIAVIGLSSSRKELFTAKIITLLTIYSEIAGLVFRSAVLQLQVQRQKKKSEEFIAFVSHELRNPLTSINGYIQMLYAKLGTQKTNEGRWSVELFNESKRFTDLVKELLTVKRSRKRFKI